MNVNSKMSTKKVEILQLIDLFIFKESMENLYFNNRITISLLAIYNFIKWFIFRILIHYFHYLYFLQSDLVTTSLIFWSSLFFSFFFCLININLFVGNKSWVLASRKGEKKRAFSRLWIFKFNWFFFFYHDF